MTFAMRVDLPPAGAYRAVAAEVALRMAKAQADAVLLVVFTGDEPVDGQLPHRALVEAVDRAVAAPVRDAALVVGERLWSYVSSDERCCPADGRTVDRQSPDALALAAEHALIGKVVLGSREDVVATMNPVGGIAAVSMQQALDRACCAILASGRAEFSAAVEAEIDELADRFTDPRAALTDDEAARVALALDDTPLRERMLLRLSDPEADVLRRLLHAVARRAQPPDDAPVCTCVGYAAYIDGHGLLASAAFERALASRPDYGMAQMLAQLLAAQVPPEEVRL